MGNPSRVSFSYDHVPLIYRGKKDGVEVDGPDPVVDLLEPDVEVFQGRGDEDELVAEANGSNPGDALDDEVAQILDGW